MSEQSIVIVMCAVWFASWIFMCCVTHKRGDFDPEGIIALFLLAIPFTCVVIIDYIVEYIKKRQGGQ